MKLKTALIIDDAAVMRLRLRDILEPQYDVVGEAEDGAQALNLYESCRPDFVTLDITMPKIDGITVLQIYSNHTPRPKSSLSVLWGKNKPSLKR